MLALSNRLQVICCTALILLAYTPETARSQGTDLFEQAPIRYSESTPKNSVETLRKQLAESDATWNYDPKLGYLPKVLEALEIPVSSQMLVFSKTSMQRGRIAPKNPRAIYFNDEVYVGYCKSGDVLELSVADPQLGAVFYTMEQSLRSTPQLVRQTESCITCHGTSQTQGFPGHLVRSVFSDAGGQPILSSGSFRIDHTSPLKQRWGGWYVTGTHGEQTHLGNLIVRTRHTRPEQIDNSAGQNVTSLDGRFDASYYPSAESDLIALMVFEHQAQAHNLITRAQHLTKIAIEFEATLNRELNEPSTYRRASTTSRIKDAGEPLVRYLLFSKEAQLTAPLQGTSSFQADFSERAIRDTQGRSLRDFDLETRLFKYPLSYTIYTPAFKELAPEVKEYVWQRILEVLQGVDTSDEFQHLSPEDRQNILEIVQATVPDLPENWRRDQPGIPDKSHEELEAQRKEERRENTEN